MTINKILKKVIINNIILDNKKTHLLKKINVLKKNELRMLCVLSSRKRAVFKKYRLSRMMFRNLADSGYLSGLRRASW